MRDQRQTPDHFSFISGSEVLFLASFNRIKHSLWDRKDLIMLLQVQHRAQLKTCSKTTALSYHESASNAERSRQTVFPQGFVGQNRTRQRHSSLQTLKKKGSAQDDLTINRSFNVHESSVDPWYHQLVPRSGSEGTAKRFTGVLFTASSLAWPCRSYMHIELRGLTSVA